MEQLDAKIKFYQQRTFGEKLNVSFDFIKANWKPLLKWVTYLILPVCLIQMVFTLKYMAFSQSLLGMMQRAVTGISMTDIPEIDWLSYSLLMLCQFIGSMFVTSVVYALIVKYNESENGIDSITLNDLKLVMTRMMGRYLLAVIALVVISTAIILICTILGLILSPTLFVTIPAFLAILIALSMLVPICLFEKTGIISAIAKSFRLGFATWGGIFLIGLIFGILTWIISGIISLPFTVVSGVSAIVGDSDVTGGGASGFNMLSYLLGVVSLYGGYIASILVTVGLAYQYSHANEKVNNVSVVDDIDHFENF